MIGCRKPTTKFVNKQIFYEKFWIFHQNFPWDYRIGSKKERDRIAVALFCDKMAVCQSLFH